jgi:ornithine decarboxylase
VLSKTVSPVEYLGRLPEALRQTPALLLDLSVLERDFRAFRQGFQGTRILYAAKANPHPAVIGELLGQGSHFEISSVGELRHLLDLGVPAQSIISSNPVKTPALVKEGWYAGMTHFAFDSTAEADKIAMLAPGARLAVRLNVPNTGSDWPLDRKFGVDAEEAASLMVYARDRGLRPEALTFHVGSQCRNLGSWREAMGLARELWDWCVDRGLDMRVLNVGGGMPVEYDRDDIPSIQQVGAAVLEAKGDLFPEEAELWLEPGRAVIGRAGVMVTSVIGSTVRGGKRWVYLDAGVFHGLEEALGGIKYRFLTQNEGPLEPCTVAGPSCDSMDVIAEGVLLPPLGPGDLVAIPSAGAYTTVYASTFNGFPAPETVILDGDR